MLRKLAMAFGVSLLCCSLSSLAQGEESCQSLFSGAPVTPAAAQKRVELDASKAAAQLIQVIKNQVRPLKETDLSFLETQTTKFLDQFIRTDDMIKKVTLWDSKNEALADRTGGDVDRLLGAVGALDAKMSKTSRRTFITSWIANRSIMGLKEKINGLDQSVSSDLYQLDSNTEQLRLLSRTILTQIRNLKTEMLFIELVRRDTMTLFDSSLPLEHFKSALQYLDKKILMKQMLMKSILSTSRRAILMKVAINQSLMKEFSRAHKSALAEKPTALSADIQGALAENSLETHQLAGALAAKSVL